MHRSEAVSEHPILIYIYAQMRISCSNTTYYGRPHWVPFLSGIHDLSLIKSLWWQIISNGIHCDATCCDSAAWLPFGRRSENVAANCAGCIMNKWRLSDSLSRCVSFFSIKTMWKIEKLWKKRKKIQNNQCGRCVRRRVMSMDAPHALHHTTNMIFIAVGRWVFSAPYEWRARAHTVPQRLPNCLFISCRMGKTVCF